MITKQLQELLNWINISSSLSATKSLKLNTHKGFSFFMLKGGQKGGGRISGNFLLFSRKRHDNLFQVMVDGSDTFLDLLSGNGNQIMLKLSKERFKGYNSRIKKIRRGLNAELLKDIGHAPVEYGAYYEVIEYNNQPYEHQLWLCPVTEYVFGDYPEEIFLKTLILH